MNQKFIGIWGWVFWHLLPSTQNLNPYCNTLATTQHSSTLIMTCKNLNLNAVSYSIYVFMANKRQLSSYNSNFIESSTVDVPVSLLFVVTSACFWCTLCAGLLEMAVREVEVMKEERELSEILRAFQSASQQAWWRLLRTPPAVLGPFEHVLFSQSCWLLFGSPNTKGCYILYI